MPAPISKEQVREYRIRGLFSPGDSSIAIKLKC